MADRVSLVGYGGVDPRDIYTPQVIYEVKLALGPVLKVLTNLIASFETPLRTSARRFRQFACLREDPQAGIVVLKIVESNPFTRAADIAKSEIVMSIQILHDGDWCELHLRCYDPDRLTRHFERLQRALDERWPGSRLQAAQPTPANPPAAEDEAREDMHLTDLEKIWLARVARYFKRPKGKSLEAFCTAEGVSVSSLTHWLRALRDKGWIDRAKRRVLITYQDEAGDT